MPPSPNDWPILREILERFAGRKILTAGEFEALADELKGTAGRLAKVWNTQFTAEIYEELYTSLREGQTVRDFADNAQKILDKYGAAEGLKIYTGDRFSPAYADLVFRTNTQAAQAAGRYKEMFDPAYDDIEPYWQYSAINDARTRPEHAALDGKVFRKDDVAARHYLPPLSFNCRCQAIPMMEHDLKSSGLKVSSGSDVPNTPLKDADGNPLLGKDGKPLTVGPPPKGWDTDRVESLVPGTLKNKAVPPPTALVPVAPPIPPLVPPSVVPLTPLVPSGQPVSKALDMTPLTKSERREVERVATLIDSVHGDGKMQQTSIRYKGGTTGTYSPPASYGRVQLGSEIEIAKASTERLQQIAHEIGHKLDFEALPGKGATSEIAAGELADVLKAIRASKAVADLSTMPPRKYLNYLLSDVELWARAYAQFIAEESGDPKLMNDIVRIRNGGVPGRIKQAQWDPVDFAPIRTKIREMMRRLGWVI